MTDIDKAGVSSTRRAWHSRQIPQELALELREQEKGVFATGRSRHGLTSFFRYAVQLRIHFWPSRP